MQIVASFEVLAQPIVPGIPDIPYVQQGAFLQISNIGSQDLGGLAIEYQATPAFVASAGAVSLFANMIDSDGNVTQYPTDLFLTPSVGFVQISIPANGTIIVGVQYVLGASQAENKVGATPQDGTATRGIISLDAPQGTQLALLATIRQVFNNYDQNGNLMGVSESAYSVPIIGGPVISF